MKNPELIYHRHNQFTKVHRMSRHIAAFHELTVVFSGRLHYTIDDEDVVLHPGDAVFVRKGRTRARKEVVNSDYISFNFHCDDDLTHLPQKIKRYVDKEIRHVINAYDERVKAPRATDFLAYVRLFLLKFEELSIRSQYSPLTEQILIYLQSNIDKRISLKSIGEYTHFSPIYCANLFKKETGSSIIEYFNQMKMEQAKQLLVENQLSLTEISASLGYDDYNYFTRLFKKICGCSPSQYRRRFLSNL